MREIFLDELSLHVSQFSSGDTDTIRYNCDLLLLTTLLETSKQGLILDQLPLARSYVVLRGQLATTTSILNRGLFGIGCDPALLPSLHEVALATFERSVHVRLELFDLFLEVRHATQVVDVIRLLDIYLRHTFG